MARESIPAPEHASRIREDRAIFRALRIIEARAIARGELVSNPEAAAALFRLSLAEEAREHFEVAFLDAGHCLIARERLFSGTIDGASVWARIVVQRALMLNAAAVLCAHNHPSGNPSPSKADHLLTDRLHDALALVDIRLLDHFVITRHSAVSVLASGYPDKEKTA